MTTNPKAKRFRTRAGGSSRAAGGAPASADAGDGFGAAPFPTAQKAAAGPGKTATAAGRGKDIEAIRQEGLSGRQLRMARRIAIRHGMPVTSGFEAVLELRRLGFDPFTPINALKLVRNEAGLADPANTPDRPFWSRKAGHHGGAALALAPGEAHLRDLQDIQRDIVRRRRRAFFLMAVRLAAFVLLPTVLAGYYYIAVATPMYATNSDFVIQRTDAQPGVGLGGLFQGTGLANQQDSITVQSYLQSRDAMLRLDDDRGFRAHFSQDWIDPLQRLPAGGSAEDAYKIYKKTVQIGYDPTEGILKMEVVAADPDTSAAFANALISYAEQRVDGLTQRLREDQMAGARQSYEEAEAKVDEAQARVLALQEKLGVLDPATETTSLMGQITTFELQLREKRLELEQLLDNPAPARGRVAGVHGDIGRLEALVADLRAAMTEGGGKGESLARISAELRIAEADLANRQLLLQQALQQLETARIEANRQVRYLSIGVSPVAPDEPSYPRVFENTLLALFIFGGIYLMISLTVSILREQVSA